MRSTRRRITIAILALGIAMSVVFAAPSRTVSAPAHDKRPDLQMLQLRDWRVQTISGQRLLRFTTIFVNAGPGRFELRGTRDSKADTTMQIDQVMYRWDGTSSRRSTPAIARYAGDGHDHWHVQGVVTYEAWKLSDPQHARRGAKTGFCFFDTTPWKLSLPYARQTPYYQQEWCGTRASLTNRVGVSVGWGDRYPWDFAFQWIDITGLPGGIYRVRATVDIQDFYAETDEFDNCVWSEVRIPTAGSGRALEVLRNGRGCGGDAMSWVDAFPGGQAFDPERTVTLDAGVHVAWSFNSHGTRIRSKWQNLRVVRTSTTSHRAIPPGASGYWLYISSGPFAGYWLKQGGGVHLGP
jgi:lysyl oxidase